MATWLPPVIGRDEPWQAAVAPCCGTGTALAFLTCFLGFAGGLGAAGGICAARGKGDSIVNEAWPREASRLAIGASELGSGIPGNAVCLVVD